MSRAIGMVSPSWAGTSVSISRSDNRPGDALGDQDLRLLDDERDDQQEGQNDQRDHEGQAGPPG